MKIATWNVNGIRARQAEVRAWVERERPAVLCLQEIKCSPAQVPEALCEMEGYWCCWHGEKGYSGVGLHVSKEAAAERPVFAHPSFDYENRIVAAAVGGITVASIYVPNGGRDFDAKMRFLEALDAYAAGFQAQGFPLVLCGDLNVARADIDVHPKERKPLVIGQRPEERWLFERILGRGLVDVLRARDPQNEGLFTWWPPWRSMRQRNIGWRIDYILASDRLAGRTLGSAVHAQVGTSDHAPVVVEFEDR